MGMKSIEGCIVQLSASIGCQSSSDVKRGQNLEAEAEAEANFWRLRPRPRPKIIIKKVSHNY